MIRSAVALEELQLRLAFHAVFSPNTTPALFDVGDLGSEEEEEEEDCAGNPREN